MHPVAYLFLAATILALTILMVQLQQRQREARDIYALRLRLGRDPTRDEIDDERERLMSERNEGFRYADETYEVFNLRMRLGHRPSESEITTELQRLERLRTT